VRSIRIIIPGDDGDDGRTEREEMVGVLGLPNQGRGEKMRKRITRQAGSIPWTTPD
jgi:hypothetical protein